MDLKRFTKGVKIRGFMTNELSQPHQEKKYADIFSEDIGQLLDLLAPLQTGNQRQRRMTVDGRLTTLVKLDD